MVKQRRSKRKVVTQTRFSARKQAQIQQDRAIYGSDYGILPSVKASIIPGRVPLGFVCGYPLNGGELYGGSMFARSAAADTLQGKAIQSVNVKWGTDVLSRSGRETIGIPVCKKKYRPFAFQIVQDRDDSDDNTDGKVKVTVERLYACQCHHPQRKAVIEQYGVRQGWQPFGVWSLRKAQEQARLETLRMNGGKKNSSDSVSYSSNNNDSKLSKSTSNADDSTDDDDNNNDVDFSDFSNGSSVNAHAVRKSLSSICLNGRCTWKFASAYDNIYKEIHGHTESEAEDNVG